MPMIEMSATPVASAEVVIERRVGEAGNRGLSPVNAGGLTPVSATAKEKVVGVCETGGEKVEVRPAYAAASYMFKFHSMDGFDDGATARLITKPKYGVLRPPEHTPVGEFWFDYIPSSRKAIEAGGDRFVFLVEKNGVAVKVQYRVIILEPGEAPGGLCDLSLWKISSGYGGQPPIDQLAISQLARHLALHDVDKRF